METDEVLSTGAGAATPPGDNLCNDYAQGLADAFGSLAAARGDRVAHDDTAALSDAGSPSMFGNVAVIRRPVDESAWPALAAQMLALSSGRPGGSFLVFSAWPTPDLRELDFGGSVIRRSCSVRRVPLHDEPIDDFEIRPVTDATTARGWEHALVHGYPEAGVAAVRGRMLPPRARPRAPRWRHWVGYLAGEAVGTASALVGDHHVDVEFISTLESARGRGIGARARRQLPCSPRRTAGDAHLQRPGAHGLRTARLHPTPALHALGRPPRTPLTHPPLMSFGAGELRDARFSRKAVMPST